MRVNGVPKEQDEAVWGVEGGVLSTSGNGYCQGGDSTWPSGSGLNPSRTVLSSVRSRCVSVCRSIATQREARAASIVSCPLANGSSRQAIMSPSLDTLVDDGKLGHVQGIVAEESLPTSATPSCRTSFPKVGEGCRTCLPSTYFRA